MGDSLSAASDTAWIRVSVDSSRTIGEPEIDFSSVPWVTVRWGGTTGVELGLYDLQLEYRRIHGWTEPETIMVSERKPVAVRFHCEHYQSAILRRIAIPARTDSL